MLRRRLFYHAGDPWRARLALKVELIDAYGGRRAVVFDTEDVLETMKLHEIQREADETLEAFRNMIDFGPEGWVPTERYDEAMTRSNQDKEDTLAAAMSVEERAEIVGHWPFHDLHVENTFDELS